MWPPQRTNRIPVRLILFILVCIGVYSAWKIAFPSGTWRYKMTVTVATPEGLKVGSAVREVYVSKGLKITPESLPYVRVTGEAVAVNLGERGVVFALLRGATRGVDYADDVVYKAFPVPDDKGALTSDGIRYYRSIGPTPPKELAHDNLPLFVRFSDPQDPKTVESLVDFQACPASNKYPKPICIKKDRFAETFGEGVILKSVTLEITEEEVTAGMVQKYLPWLEERAKYPGWIGADPRERMDPTKTELTPGDFRTRK